MRNALARRVGIVTLFGMLVLSVGLVCLVFMTGSAGAAPPNKSGSTSTQNWDTTLPADQRFTVLAGFNNQAVRDNETGLVWEQSPEAQHRSSADARLTCAHNSRKVGGRKGWRLPSLPELGSLIDTSKAVPGPFLPDGHPFANIQLDNPYWTATSNDDNLTQAWTVDFGNSNVGPNDKTLSGGLYVWCVRGPMQESAY